MLPPPFQTKQGFTQKYVSTKKSLIHWANSLRTCNILSSINCSAQCAGHEKLKWAFNGVFHIPINWNYYGQYYENKSYFDMFTLLRIKEYSKLNNIFSSKGYYVSFNYNFGCNGLSYLVSPRCICMLPHTKKMIGILMPYLPFIYLLISYRRKQKTKTF